MNIGQVAAFTGLTVRSIRHYESLGLILPKRSKTNLYRTYSDRDIYTLKFIYQCRQLGFGLEQCRLLLERHQPEQAEALQKLVGDKLAELDDQLTILQQVRENLVQLIESPDLEMALPCINLETMKHTQLFRLL